MRLVQIEAANVSKQILVTLLLSNMQKYMRLRVKYILG
jgi:hypothetical protein